MNPLDSPKFIEAWIMAANEGPVRSDLSPIWLAPVIDRSECRKAGFKGAHFQGTGDIHIGKAQFA